MLEMQNDVKVDERPEDEILNVHHKSQFQKNENACRLDWRDIECNIDIKDKGVVKTRRILKGVSGFAKPGEILAIMGSSGAGKTTLLNYLANQQGGSGSEGFQNSNISFSGKVYFNGKQISDKDFKSQVAYVRQEDILFPTLSAREILQFSAKLRLSASIPVEDKLKKVEHLIEDLGLVNCANTRIGSADERGLSGGEKKRVSIAVELVTDPSLIFLDEPTSGLDSFSAYNVLKTLKSMAIQGQRTVVCTIHQPSSEIFGLFDRLCLLADGEIVYFGKAKEAVNHFNNIGFKCPIYSNPADYFLNILHVQNNDAEDLERVQKIKDGYDVSKNTNKEGSENEFAYELSDDKLVLPEVSFQRPSGLLEVMLLTQRAFRNHIRQKLTSRARLGQTVFMALLTGLLYLNIGTNQTSITDRQGAIFFVLVNNFMSSAMMQVLTFPTERVIFTRENSNGMYGTLSYFLSKIAVEFPIQTIFPIIYSFIAYYLVGFRDDGIGIFLTCCILLVLSAQSIGLVVGCAAPNATIAVSLAPVSIVPFLLFSGFFINPDDIPVYFVWMKEISPFRYGFEILLINEFKDMEFTCDSDELIPPGICPITNGNQVIDRFSVDPDDLWPWHLSLIYITATGLFIAYLILRFRK